MALDLTQEQKQQGRENFTNATGELTRRGFMKSMVAAGAVVPVSAAVYFGYKEWTKGNPVRAALIGAGDEGGVLIGEHNPEFLQIVAVADIRPYNRERIFEGEPAPSPRKGLKRIYGVDEAKKIEQFAHYEDLLKSDVIDRLKLEAVVIALPLHLHAACAIAAMDLGLHVMCEKLMARTIGMCKMMTKKAKEKNVILSIGHQRHYSMLYAHALEVVQSGILGDIKHIRALWHRNNSWPWKPSDAKKPLATGVRQPDLRDGWFGPIYDLDAEALRKDPALWNRANEFLKANQDKRFTPQEYDSIEQLLRWRLYDKTGGGLMAELGSHQLDASSIFLGKVHPLAVTGVGARAFYGDLSRPNSGPNPRESEDAVFVSFEFPGKNHPRGANKGSDESDVVVVTYSSLNTNSFEQYGECLMGSRGTMVVEGEADVFLYKEPDPIKRDNAGKSTAVQVTAAGGKPAMEASSTWAVGGGPGVVSKTGNASGWGSVSRGYREEMEHFAFCVRELQSGRADQQAKLGSRSMQNVYEKDSEGQYVLAKEKRLPKCHGEVAMADAILALTANMAMDKKVRIEFDPNWFDTDKPDVPETKYGKDARPEKA
ncbi:MAG TPA: Gfo/Idh/MocA family oxidoreductase [Gemmataceae bacterium]|nr:Gfo/Idh/MocA family oxidoreductase [Gemmataceae bacterium]